MIELHYSAKRNLPIVSDDDLLFDLGSEVEEYECQDEDDLIESVQNLLLSDDDKTVYLFAIEFSDNFDTSDSKIEDEIYVHHNATFVEFFLSSHLFLEHIEKVFLFECNSYEEAYKMALDMREGNPLCFD